MDYHNEIDSYCARWLRNLMKTGHIPQGFVDERDIRDVKPMDLWGFNRCHFFSGLGGWAHALRLADVPDDLPLWTGSCPCQPFSAAGQRKGAADERHLWPYWYYLIEQSRPAIVLGKQVASPDGFTWLDLVQADLEGVGYACGASVLPAACVQAPHERHRIWFVAHSDGQYGDRSRSLWSSRRHEPANSCEGVSDAISPGLAQREVLTGVRGAANGASPRQDSGAHRHHLPNADGEPLGRLAEPRRQCGHWAVEPSLGRVADGIPSRVDQLRALGNSIVPQVAAVFIEAALDLRPVRVTHVD